MLPPELQAILLEAFEKEKAYDWSGGIEMLCNFLETTPQQNPLSLGEVHEYLGNAYFHHAFQADTHESFLNICNKALANYRKASDCFARSENHQARKLRSLAMRKYIECWLNPEVAAKRELMNECWNLTKEALRAFEESHDTLECGKTYNQLSLSAGFASFLEADYRASEKTLREAVELGDQTVTLLSSLGDSDELAKAYVRTAVFMELFAYYFLNSDSKAGYYEEAGGYWLMANEFSEETAKIELLNSAPLAVLESLGWGDGTDEAIANFEQALEYGRKTRDKFLIGCAMDWLAYNNFWRAVGTENPEERAEIYGKALQYALEARKEYAIASFISPRVGVLWVEAPHAEYYWRLASYETDPKNRRELLEEAKQQASEQLERAQKSGYTLIIATAHHVTSRILADLAKTKKTAIEKRALLEQARVHRDKSITILDQIAPFDYWNKGVARTFLADIKSELANICLDAESKKQILAEAVADKECSLLFFSKDIDSLQEESTLSLLPAIGGYQYEHGNLLIRLYRLNNNRGHLEQATKAYEKAAQSFGKPDVVSRAAECYWKAGETYDLLGEHLKASKSFFLASGNYEKASEKIPQLREFYRDHASYMQAWYEIETAKHLHRKQEYGTAKDHFEKAARIHESLEQWNFLAPNYRALAQLESAEESSRKDESEEALKAFENASRLFIEAKQSLQRQAGKLENLEEKRFAQDMLNTAGLRSEYCTARKSLEEARILDKRGEHHSSAANYGTAAEVFERIADSLKEEKDREEIVCITQLSRAWQKMMLAEAERKSHLYDDASKLFIGAKDHCQNEKAKAMTLGHSYFCRALEAETQYADTGNESDHTSALQNLEKASNCYLQGDCLNASEYVKATTLLFEAYVHLENAAKTTEPEAKTRQYMAAEKILQTSAGSYMKAGYPAKREHALKLLEKAREERDLAKSLIEVLHAPLVNSTATFAAPTPTSERAVGLEKFEHADIQANIIMPKRELKIGENLDIEIELVNVGRGAAMLMKIEGVIPEGFEIEAKPELFRVEDNCVNMRGKRIEPLKTEEVKMILKPMSQGEFTLKPTITFVDENGEPRKYQPKPESVSVRELGISGWLKGPGKAKQT